MNERFIENLEHRQLLSAFVTGHHAPDASIAAVVQPLATKKIPRVVGRWEGYEKFRVGSTWTTMDLVVKVTKQDSKGNFWAKGWLPQDSKSSYSFTGKVGANRKFTYKISGRNRYGPDYGSGTGTLNASATVINGNGNWHQGGQTGPTAFHLERT